MATKSTATLLKLVVFGVAVGAIALVYFYTKNQAEILDESANKDRWENRDTAHRIANNDPTTSDPIAQELSQLRASLEQKRAASAAEFNVPADELTAEQAANLNGLRRQLSRSLAGQYTRKQIHLVTPAIRELLSDASHDAIAKTDEPAKLSWRVHVLPYIGQQALYDQFHLDETWDSEHNIALIDPMPMLYRGLYDKADAIVTRLLAIDAPGALGNGGRLQAISDVKDAQADTLAIVIAGTKHAVPWTSPQDFTVDAQSFSEAMQGMPKPTYWVGTIEGAALDVRHDGSFETFKSLMTINGGEENAVDAMVKEKFQLMKADK